ncbi:hypothetical protein N9980_00750 [bacterium]|nr:hypothetical protein [bacterium]
MSDSQNVMLIDHDSALELKLMLSSMQHDLDIGPRSPFVLIPFSRMCAVPDMPFVSVTFAPGIEASIPKGNIRGLCTISVR